MSDFKEFRSIPLVGFNPAYQVNRSGEWRKGGVPLTVNDKWTVNATVGNVQKSFSLHYLIDKAFPEFPDDEYRVLRRNGLFTFFIRTGTYGEPYAWRREWGPVRKDSFSPKQIDIAVDYGWAGLLKSERVIDGDEYLRRKQDDAETRAAAWDKSYPLSAVSEDEQLDVESSFESLKRDAPITDPLVTLAEALASTAEAIRLLVKNRSGQ